MCVYLSSPQFTEYSLRGGFGNFINQGMAKVWMPYSWSTLVAYSNSIIIIPELNSADMPSTWVNPVLELSYLAKIIVISLRENNSSLTFVHIPYTHSHQSIT